MNAGPSVIVVVAVGLVTAGMLLNRGTRRFRAAASREQALRALGDVVRRVRDAPGAN